MRIITPLKERTWGSEDVSCTWYPENHFPVLGSLFGPGDPCGTAEAAFYPVEAFRGLKKY